MHVIVAGCGRIGAGLASALSGAGHDVVVIDIDQARFARLGSAFNGIKLRGAGQGEEALLEAGIQQCDFFAAVTDSDATNIMAAEIASRIFRVPHVVVRVNQPELELTVEILELDHVCDAALTVQAMIEKATGAGVAPRAAGK